MPILDVTGDTGLADGTVNALILDTQRHLNSTRRAELSRLETTITSAADTLVTTYAPAGLRTGAVIALGDEIVYVWDFDTATKTATIERGYGGSVASAHTAGALIEIEPTYPRAHILGALRDEILSWSTSVYQEVRTTLAATSTSRSIALPATNVIKVLDVHRAPPSGGTAPRRLSFRHLAGQDNTLYPTGHVISLDEEVDAATTLFVTYAAPFSVSSFDASTSLDAIGLSDNLLDIPPLGAAARLVTAQEITRNDTQAQGQSRSAEHVPPTSLARTGLGLKQLRDQRLNDEANRLNHKYAWRW